MSFGSTPDSTSWRFRSEPIASGDMPVSSEHQLPGHFEKILEKMLSASHDGVSIETDPNHTELVRVALKYSSMDFCVEPVLLELVRVLTAQFEEISQAQRTALERRIALSFADDQVSMQRLQLLWDHLKGLVSNAK